MMRKLSGHCIHRKAAVGVYVLLTGMAVSPWLFGDSATAQDGVPSREHLEWQRACVKQNLYRRSARRVVLKRFGVSIEVPEDMDFQVGGNSDKSSVKIVDIEDIVQKKCNELALGLHGMALPGRGISGISISSRPRFPARSPLQDEFVDAVIVLGQKRPVYANAIEFWTVFTAPGRESLVQVSSHDVDLSYFIRFLKSIRADSPNANQ